MERLSPAEILRKYAFALESSQRLEGVSRLQRCQDFDQEMLLALNGALDRPLGSLPDTGTVLEWLKERLISVSAPGQDDAVLGLFYTNRYPFHHVPYSQVVAGIFPLYPYEVEYLLCPNFSYNKFFGSITVDSESDTEEDPFFVKNDKGPNFLFFKRSPFQPDNPYLIPLAQRWGPSDLKSHERTLEENVIKYALWQNTVQRVVPWLFRQKGFAGFIRKHRFNQRYAELYEVFTQYRNYTLYR